jgi:CHASE3 domain sensor protein
MRQRPAPQPEPADDDIYALLRTYQEANQARQEAVGTKSPRSTELRTRLAQRLTDELIETLEANIDVALTEAAKEELAVAVFEYAVEIVMEAEEKVFKNGLREISQKEIREETGRKLQSSMLGDQIVAAIGLGLLLAPLTILINAITVNSPDWIPIAFLLSVVGFLILMFTFRRAS